MSSSEEMIWKKFISNNLNDIEWLNDFVGVCFLFNTTISNWSEEVILKYGFKLLFQNTYTTNFVDKFLVKVEKLWSILKKSYCNAQNMVQNH